MWDSRAAECQERSTGPHGDSHKPEARMLLNEAFALWKIVIFHHYMLKHNAISIIFKLSSTKNSYFNFKIWQVLTVINK